jgi:hypothetical protein
MLEENKLEEICKPVEVTLSVITMSPGKVVYNEKTRRLEKGYSFNVVADPLASARIEALLRQAVPCYIVVGSTQAQYDVVGTLTSPTEASSRQFPNEAKSLNLFPDNGTEEDEESDDYESGEEEETSAAEEVTAEQASFSVEPPEGADPAVIPTEELTATKVTEEKKNGRTPAIDPSQIVDASSFIDLTTFDQRQADGKAVPHAFFLLGVKVECPKGMTLKDGIIELFRTFDVVCDTPAQLAAIIAQYPESDNRNIILEILNAPEEKKQRSSRKKKETEEPRELVGAGVGGGEGETASSAEQSE